MMTVDELVSLVEGLADRMTIRNFLDFDITSRLNDQQLGILARFLAGERPQAGSLPEYSGPVDYPTSPGRRREPTPTGWQERLKDQLPSAGAELDEPAEPSDGPTGSFGERTSDGLRLSAGEFDGVTLP